MERLAPAPGTDPEFDKVMESINAAVDADPSVAATISTEIRRETFARAMKKWGGKDHTSGEAAVPDPEPVDQGPRSLAVPTAATEPYWYEKPEDAAFIEHYILSRVALGKRLSGGLLITGPAGSGKTQGAIKAVERINAAHSGLGLPLLVMHCPTITDPQKWFGRREVDATGTRYEKSDFVNMVESGAVIVLDEFMRLHPTIHNEVMSLLDSQETVLLSDLNLQITRHPRTVFIGTTNIGAQYGGTYRMDWAMRERWSFTVEREFPPREEEIRILTSHNPGCDADAASVLVDIADKTRQMWETGDLRSPISTRTLDNAAFLVASGMTEAEALRRTAEPEYDAGAEGLVGQESDRTKFRAIVDGRTNRRR